MTTKKIGALAGLAALSLAAVACTSEPGGGKAATSPEPTLAPVEAVQVATTFVEAFGAFDAERAITYLADDADITDLVTSIGASGLEGTSEELRLLISLLEAQRYEQTLDSCQGSSSSSAGTSISCAFDFHLFGSDAIRLGPYTGSSFDLTVRDGEIVRAEMGFETQEFSPQMWEPFAGWVSTTHPDDAAVMYMDETYTGIRLTEESIPLWERHVRGFVKAVKRGALN